MIKKLKIIMITIIFTVSGFSLPILAESEYGISLEYIDEQENEVRYLIDLLGYKFYGEGITPTTDGVYLKKIWINTPEIFWYDQIGRESIENKQFVFFDVKISPDQGIIGNYKDIKECGIYQNGWMLTVKEVILNNQGLSVRGLIYLPMNFKGMPVWFTQSLNHDLKPGPAYMYNYDYNLTTKEGPLHIIKSELSGDLILVEKAIWPVPDLLDT